MTAETVYWVWLQQALGAGCRTDEILSAYPTAKALYESSEMDRRISGVFTPKQIGRLSNTPLSKAEEILARCKALSQTVLSPDDEDYTESLRTLRDMPLALYVRGNITILRNRLAIGVVGSRKPSLYSLDVARKICRDLARADAVVVSGCANGIDAASHEGALAGEGFTVGVLGCGLNTRYLMGNAPLREQITQHGALITEYPPDSEPLAAHFPLRNRIISGLSSGVCVIEAGEKSGSLITARFAVEQGKDVFGVPGNLTSMDYTGVNRLIRDGAKPVFSAQDVLSNYMWVYEDTDAGMLSVQPAPPIPEPVPQPTKTPQKPQTPEKIVKRPVDDFVSEDAKRIYALFTEAPMYTDDLVRTSGFEPNRVFTALTELEICGFIKLIEGKRYTIS